MYRDKNFALQNVSVTLDSFTLMYGVEETSAEFETVVLILDEADLSNNGCCRLCCCKNNEIEN